MRAPFSAFSCLFGLLAAARSAAPGYGDLSGADRQLHAHSRRALAGATHPDVGLAELFLPLSRSCNPDCSARGNCNLETGSCECPFGFGGPACRDALLAACQQGPEQRPFWGFSVPRSCECGRQARRFFNCMDGQETCTLFSFFFRDTTCFQLVGRPAAEQWSAVPAADAPGVEWFRGNLARADPPHGMRRLEAAEHGTGLGRWDSKALHLPLERCGAHRCSEYGACQLPVPNPDPNPHCLCFKGRKGHDCSTPQEEMCVNNCLGRGSCDRGFCHCRPPYFGADCSRQHAWQLAPGAVPVPNRARLRIYIYELPTHIAFPVQLDDDLEDSPFKFYFTHRIFREMLSVDEAVRTENPWEANLFFVPALAFSYASNTNSPGNQILRAMSYVRDAYPWFNASGGRDHFVWTTGDRGSCYLPEEIRHVILVTQFGLHVSLRANRTTFMHPLPLHPDHGCYHPAKDVLAAPWFDDHQGVSDAPAVYRAVVGAGGADATRDVLVFFAGSVRPKDKVYSGGVRQALALHLKELLDGNLTAAPGQLQRPNNSDVLFIEGHTQHYGDLHKRSKFCLAPHGSGFGIRLTIAMAHACIPVIIQDNVWQPYESEGLLPYHEFSLRLGKADIPHLLPILRSVSAARLAELRLGMARHYGAFVWSPRLGGTAYNLTVAALQRRLHGVWGKLWHNERR